MIFVMQFNDFCSPFAINKKPGIRTPERSHGLRAAPGGILYWHLGAEVTCTYMASNLLAMASNLIAPRWPPEVHQMLQSTSHRERLQIMRSALMQEEP